MSSLTLPSQELIAPDSPYQEVAHEYFSYNPELLNDASISYRELQKLSMKLGLGGSGKRAVIVRRLQAWHKRYLIRDKDSPQKNFALVEVDVDKAGKKGAISPRLLSPLKKRPNKNRRKADGTPRGILSPHGRKHCLKRVDPAMDYKTWLQDQQGQDKENVPVQTNTMPENEEIVEKEVKKVKEKRRISFSCINGTRLIPVRPPTPEKTFWRSNSYEEDYDEDDYEQDYEQDDYQQQYGRDGYEQEEEQEEQEEEQQYEGEMRQCNEYYECPDGDDDDDELKDGDDDDELKDCDVQQLQPEGTEVEQEQVEVLEDIEKMLEEHEKRVKEHRRESAKKRKKRRCSVEQLRQPRSSNHTTLEAMCEPFHEDEGDDYEEGELKEDEI